MKRRRVKQSSVLSKQVLADLRKRLNYIRPLSPKELKEVTIETGI